MSDKPPTRPLRPVPGRPTPFQVQSAVTLRPHYLFPKLKIPNPKSFIPPLACLIVVLAWFSPWWIGGRNLAPLDLLNGMMSPWRAGTETQFAKNHIVSDGVDQYLVYRMIAEKSYREEGWVGWSSLSYGGTAQYANTMALYYDWTMQLHRWFDFWTAWHLGLMGQVLLAAWGMLWFLRGRSIGPLWASCGALAYAANSQFVTWIYHRWALGAFCWVPWILWAIDHYRHGKRRSWLWVPVFMALAFLGGTLQHAALVVLAVVAIWMEEAIQTTLKPAPQLRLLSRYAAWGLLGVGLAAMMFLPCVDAFLKSEVLGLHTGLHGKPENGIYPSGYLQPLFNLAAYPFQVFPSLLGRCDSLDLLKIFKSELLYVVYFGSLPVLVAFLTPWRKDAPLLARLLVGGGLLLPLTPLVRVLYQRLFLLFILGGLLAFTHFMESATRETRLRVSRISRRLAALAIIGWTSLSVLLHFQAPVLAKLREKILAESAGSSFGFFHDWVAARTDNFIHDLFIWSPQQLAPLVLFGAALAGLQLTASVREGWRCRGAWLVALAVTGEVMLFGSRWIVWTDPARYPLFPATAETAALLERVGHDGRTTTLIHPTAHMACTPFIPNTLSAYSIASISGYDSIVPNGMLLPNESPGDADRLGRLGVSHLLTWPGNADVAREWKLVWKSPSMALYENSLKMPRYLGFRSDADKDEFFAGGRPQIVPLEEKSGKENSRALESPPGIRWVRLAENQADGWEYRSSQSASWQNVGRAPDASMIFEIPQSEGPARVEMRYNPPLRRLGLMVSAISLGLLVLGQILVIRPRRQIP